MMTKVMLIMNTITMEILMMITMNHDIDPARGLNNWLSVDAQESVQIPEHFETTKNPKSKSSIIRTSTNTWFSRYLFSI